MTKILMTSVRDDEQAAIKQFAQEHDVEIITTPKLIDDAVDLTAGVDGLVIQQRSPVDPAVYPQLKANGLKQIATRTAGFDMVDVQAAHDNGLTVTNVPAYSPRSVAEHALMQIFRLLRKSYRFDAQVAQNDFRWFSDEQALEIHTATIGIIGVGRIGGTLAKLLKALGARVLGFDVKPREEMRGIVEYVSKEDLLRQSDVVSLHVDLNPTSTGLIAAPDLALMKPTAGLVNASRGPVVVTADLVAALKDHQLAAAALDTFEGENEVVMTDRREKGLADVPLVEELHAMDNVILTPHIAFFTNLAVKNMVDFALEDVLLILAGKHSPHEV
ncbi:MAG: D-2-hydroxyacid dehydrogenase [Limosilactobacillus oris]|jgi:D-lactate dehydrogenase|uniref:D-2-hydroxyacid dehydrogenase n=1 Tax=Limosilactobacillus oris TaxID=1632 RepID=UPI000789DF81|nr:D-2-hydroxyacid dehydrogenase [Limosilactobacillus oris]AMS08072.1 lactate dehydrogenase [Limosilactobacillus oris]MCH3910618.1 D-2-hydroxyacid dehydrogenase [Limosilactobacillus oris]MCH3937870.1 D-2-hydroxyacid dehydrogenase [Limosilactobacillus oris]MCI1979982.1 D-2-hydroxyacid dehydrogenase [Limosilactobacillus oris]